jgi:hypothetical protein
MTGVWFVMGKIFLFSIASRPALRPTQPPIQWVPGAFSPGVKQQALEADHSPPSDARVKNGGAIPPLSLKSSWHGAELIKHRGNFTLTFIRQLFCSLVDINILPTTDLFAIVNREFWVEPTKPIFLLH